MDRLRHQPGEHQRDRGRAADVKGLVQRPRRFLPRPLQRHRRPADDQLSLWLGGDGRIRRPGEPAGSAEHREHAAGADHRLRHDQALEHERRLQPLLQCPRLALAAGGLRLPACDHDINSYYPGGYVNLLFGRSFTFGGVTTGTGAFGYYAVHDRRITDQAGSDIQSLYVQDQWMLGNRLTLNLGIRTEDENIPDFRPEADGAAAIKFSMKDKLAPRVGAAFDVWGDGRMKVFGSWGLYYDWTKYELPRGSFGAETWCTNYRALDTLDFGSLNLSNMPGRDLWVTPGACRDRRFQAEVDPHQADEAGEREWRCRVPAGPQQRSHRALHSQRSAGDDRGHRLPHGPATKGK